jgi:Dyp-type peroxidase family
VIRSIAPALELDDIQGDMLTGMQKNAELFLFFKITDAARFKATVRQHLVHQLTSTRRVHQREQIVDRSRRLGDPPGQQWLGLNLGFTKDGLTQLLGPRRPTMGEAFERGAAHPDTVKLLNDPPPETWVDGFLSDRIDGVLLIAGPNPAVVTYHGNSLRRRLEGGAKLVYSEMGTVRPGRDRRREHFGFTDGISQPGIRGLTAMSRPRSAPEQGLPGQDLVWPGEFVLGYPGQSQGYPDKPGPVAPLPAPWARNGSYMVFRRLEQRVPEFRSFVAARGAGLGMHPELLASRMVGRWPSGAPLELAPLADNAALGANDMRNNDFNYADDPFQRACPYAAHIRKMNPRDDLPAGDALSHRIIRAGIAFGPEVMPGETETRHSRGLLFVCYQASIERQFEFLQARYADNSDFVSGKRRPGDGSPVVPGYDPIVGQAPDDAARTMDEPVPNYPVGNRRSTLDLPEQFVRVTAAGYFFMPSLSALRTTLT